VAARRGRWQLAGAAVMAGHAAYGLVGQCL